MTNHRSLLVLIVLIGSMSAHANLILNGDFEAGNSGFGTDYVFNPTVPAVATYTVDSTVPNGWAPGFGDHTSGLGLMAIFNASTSSSDRVWEQNVELVAGADYEFSFWVAALTESIRPGTSPWIQVGLEGIKPIWNFRTAAIDDVWQNFTHSFTASATGSHTIFMREARGLASGDDFAIDDLSLLRADVAVPEPPTLHLLIAGVMLLRFRATRAARR